MSTSANDVLRSRSVGHAVYLERYKAGVWQRLGRLLDQADVDLVAELQKRASPLTEYRLEQLLDAVRQMNAEAMKGYRAALRSELRGLAGYELDYQQRLVQQAVPGAVVADLSIAAPTMGAVYSAAMSRPFQGRVLRDWAGGLERSRLAKVSQAIRLSVVEGEPIQKTVQRIRGTKALRYRDGVLAVSRREAESVARTAVNHVVTQARQQFYEVNDDLVKGWQFVATLDSRTCWSPDSPVMMADGSYRPIGDLRPGDMVTGGASGTPCRVAAVHRTREASSVAIYLAGRYVGRATHDHRILTADGWARAADLRVHPGVPERKVLHRRLPGHACAGGRASGAGSVGLQVRAVVRDSQVRHAEADDRGQGAELRGGIRDRGGPHRAQEDASPERLQHDGGRGGCGRADPGAVTEDRPGSVAGLSAEVEGRSGVSAPDDRHLRARRAEDFGGEQGVLRHSGGPGAACSAGVLAVAGEGRGIQSEAEIAGGSGEDVGTGEGALARPGVPPEGERRARGPAGGAASVEPRMEGGSCCQGGRDHAQEVAGPRLPGEDGGPGARSGRQGKARRGRSEGRGRVDRGRAREEACCLESVHDRALEYPVIPVEDAGIDESPASAFEVVGDVEIVSLSIEGDETYVVGGLIVHNTPECQSLDGKVFKIGEGPQPPRHFGCRSSSVPVLRSWRELGLDRDELPPGTRASMNGQVPATQTYGEWLKQQPAAVQEAALGKQKARLFRSGGLAVDRFVAPTGRPYTLDELRAREAAAFDRAGL